MIDSLALSEILEGKGFFAHYDWADPLRARNITKMRRGNKMRVLIVLNLLVDLYGIIIILKIQIVDLLFTEELP
jgi:hypothetical protein